MKQKKFNKCAVYRFKRFARKAYSAFNSMHKVVNIGVVTAGVLTFAHATDSSAQGVAVERQNGDKVAELELEEVTVTASHLEVPLSQTAQIVTVISKDEIARKPVSSIQDLLNYVSNIDVVQRGGHGVQADISIRGGSADQTAVLLNGVNLSNPHTGHYSFDIPINISDIERIEILHGPSALIYGSSAFSGGINIITKKKPDSKLYAKLESGMHYLRGAEVRGEIGRRCVHSSLSLGHQTADGYVEHSDYKIYNVLWQTRIHAEGDSRIDVQAGYNNKHYGANTFYSAAYPNQYERTSEILSSASGVFGKQLKIIPLMYWTRHLDQFDLIRNTDKGRNFHRGDTYGANLMFRLGGRLGATDFGGEVRREEMCSSNLGRLMAEPHGNYARYDGRTQTNLVALHTFDVQKFTLSAGFLANYNTLQDDKIRFYPSVSAVYRPRCDLRLYAAWSRSSRLPTFTDLYYTTATHHADETLQAERSESFDLGMKYFHDYFMLSVTGYLMNGRNMIDWVRDSGESKWASWNFTEVDKRGLEVRLEIPVYQVIPSFPHSRLALNYARMHQDCDSKGLESRYTLNYLRDKLTAHFMHEIGKVSASWNFRYQKRMGEYSRYENAQYVGLVPYRAFSTLDLRLKYGIRKVFFYLDFNNLFDTEYCDIGNVPQAGFWLMGGISWKL